MDSKLSRDACGVPVLVEETHDLVRIDRLRWLGAWLLNNKAFGSTCAIKRGFKRLPNPCVALEDTVETAPVVPVRLVI